MRPIRYILDLPWWVGLAIFMAGNWIVGYHYMLGVPVCLFGAWTYSKLLRPYEDGEPGWAIIGIPLFFFVMIIPRRFSFELEWLHWLNGASETLIYGIRAALGIGAGFMAFQGVRK